MDTRTGIASLSVGLIAVGAGLLGATRQTASGWLGRATTTIPGGRVAVRAVGAVGDVVDGVATLASGRRNAAAMTSAALAFGAAIAGVAFTVALHRD